MREVHPGEFKASSRARILAELGEKVVDCPRLALSPRMAESLAAAAIWPTSSEVAARLGLSNQTVKNHLAAARKRLGAEHTTHAVWLGWSQIAGLIARFEAEVGRPIGAAA